MLVRVVAAPASEDSSRQLALVLDEVEADVTHLPPAETAAASEVYGGDLLFIDRERLPERPTSWLRQIRSKPEAPEVVVLREREDATERAALLAEGALAVLHRHLPEEMLVSLVQRLLERRQRDLRSMLRAAAVSAETPLEPKLRTEQTSSPAMREALELAQWAAETTSSVLLRGETGTGKEYLARAIHAASSRADGPFVAVNCAGIPETLLESELFGHEKGAYTGAERRHRGYFERSHGGTLFLDEIGDMPLGLQSRLLRVLEDRAIVRLGSEKEVDLDLRILTATHRDLERASAEGSFRLDLYYRLAVVTIDVPPLRERREDLPALARVLVERCRRRLGYRDLEVTEEALDVLTNHSWPGNVRELANVLERGALISRGARIESHHLGFLTGVPQAPTAGEDGWQDEWLDRPLAEVRRAAADQRQYLTRLLTVHQGRIAESARRAGMDPRSLHRKMREHGLHKEQFKPS